MLKKIIVLACSLMLMSCQENSKANIQDLINKKDFVNAKVLVEDKLGQHPQDDYYNGAMGYILAVECLSTNCVQNNPDNLKKIKHYSQKSAGLAKINDNYFVDFYQQTIEKMVLLAAKQEDLTTARLTLKEFVNRSNSRLHFIYQQLYKGALANLLEEDFKTSSLNLLLIQEFNFNLTEEQKESVEFLLNLEENLPLKDVKKKIKAYNRAFIGSNLPHEFLVTAAPAIVEYAVTNDIDDITNVLSNTIKERSTLFGENVASLRQKDNVKYYARGIELISTSQKMIQHISQNQGYDKKELIIELQNISLKLNSNNADLWITYIKNILNNGDIKNLYNNINIEIIPSKIVISNNDMILAHAKEVYKTQSITTILDEMVFRDDSNKDTYTQKTINLVEEALKFEISKNNLDGIFEYLNYVPTIKEKFKDQLNKRLNEYIDLAWDSNDFKNLNKLIGLYSDLNKTTDNNILIALFEDYLLNETSQDFFKANKIKELINLSPEDPAIDDDLASKYEFVLKNLKNEEIQTTLFSVARKLQGIYAQSKLFSYFSEVFSKEKVDDLISDSVITDLAKDTDKNLLDLIELSGFLINKTNKLPDSFIASEIIPRFNNLTDITVAWNAASNSTRKELVNYNIDIKNLIKVVENDKANKKITASTYIGKIKSPEILPFVAKYKKLYQSYINQIKGFYIKDNNNKGAEIIRVSPTTNLLQVNVEFISRLGNIENLDKYKLDRGEVISKSFKTYYNPVNSSIKLKGKYKPKEKQVFVKTDTLLLDGKFLILNKNKYHKVKSLFGFNKRYGIVEQITERTQDNFHILPEGSSFTITEEISKNIYNIELNHPAMATPIKATAKYNPQTAEFIFEYNYTIKLFSKNFSAKAKCQIVDTKAHCAVQDKYWKRQEYSVILKALQVK